MRVDWQSSSQLDETEGTLHDFGFVIEETDEALTVFEINLWHTECQKGRTLRLWSSPIKREPAKLDEYAKSFLKYRDRRTRDAMSDYNIMQFGSISDCTEAIVLAWAYEQNGFRDLAAKLFARAEREARKPGSLAAPCRRAVVLLRQMIAEDERHARQRSDGPAFDQLSRGKQIAELIFQLRDQHGGSIDSPEGFVFLDEVDSPAHQLTRYGFDAVPQLIAALDDTALTWSIGYGEDYLFTDRVLRVGDCAEQVLAAIAGRRTFADHTSRGAEMIQGDNAARVRQAALDWFDAAKQQGEFQVLSDSVAEGGFFCVGQAEILVLKHGELALDAIIAGVKARAESRLHSMDQWILLQLVHRIPGKEATTYLIQQARNNPNWTSRFVAAWGLHQRGRAEGVETMLALWRIDKPQPPNLPGDPPYVKKSFQTSELIWFLLRCGKAKAIEAVAAKLGHWESTVIELAILDIAFVRDTFYGGHACRPEDAPRSVRDDPITVRQAHLQLLAGLLNKKSSVASQSFGQEGNWERWREGARICDFAAAALARLDPDRFQFDIAASEPERNEQIARLKLLQ